jgi:hypothetical protein
MSVLEISIAKSILNVWDYKQRRTDELEADNQLYFDLEDSPLARVHLQLRESIKIVVDDQEMTIDLSNTNFYSKTFMIRNVNSTGYFSVNGVRVNEDSDTNVETLTPRTGGMRQGTDNVEIEQKREFEMNTVLPIVCEIREGIDFDAMILIHYTLKNKTENNFRSPQSYFGLIPIQYSDHNYEPGIQSVQHQQQFELYLRKSEMEEIKIFSTSSPGPRKTMTEIGRININIPKSQEQLSSKELIINSIPLNNFTTSRKGTQINIRCNENDLDYVFKQEEIENVHLNLVYNVKDLDEIFQREINTRNFDDGTGRHEVNDYLLYDNLTMILAKTPMDYFRISLKSGTKSLINMLNHVHFKYILRENRCYKQVTTQLPVIITGSYDKLIAT